jgi:LysR family hydrogen peroxide-inducible transcriptional activator
VYPLFSESFVLAIPDGNPLASRKSIPMNSLEQQSLLLLEEGHCLRDQTLNFCEHLAIHERQDFRATSLETLRQMVIAKVGITVLPQMAVQNQPGIAYRPFAAPEPKREIVLVARNTSPRKPLMQAMQAVISKLY